MKYKKIGIIGAGVIGSAISKFVASLPEVQLSFILVDQGYDKNSLPLPLRNHLTVEPELALSTLPDLVVEAATPGVLASIGLRALVQADVVAFSCTALADPKIQQEFERIEREFGKKLIIPHGALLALDGITDGRDCIQRVEITTIKNGSSFGLSIDQGGVFYDGATREACLKYPRNVNVHAAVALAGIGFDKTKSILIADPSSQEMRHIMKVTGVGFSWKIEVTSQSLGGVSGSYTPQSAIGSIKRLIERGSVHIC